MSDASRTPQDEMGLMAEAFRRIRDLELQTVGRGIRSPHGVLGFAQRVTGVSGVSTETDLSGLSVSVSVPTGRLIMVSALAQLQPSTGSLVDLSIYGGGTKLVQMRQSALGVFHASGFALDTPAPGSVIYKLTLRTNTGTVDLQATSTVPAIILVQDIGPA